jgi:hypothetical protein
VKDGKLKYCYNWLDRERYTLESKQALPAGKVTVKFEFNYDGGGVGKCGSGQLLVNGQKVRRESRAPNPLSSQRMKPRTLART